MHVVDIARGLLTMSMRRGRSDEDHHHRRPNQRAAGSGSAHAGRRYRPLEVVAGGRSAERATWRRRRNSSRRSRKGSRPPTKVASWITTPCVAEFERRYRSRMRVRWTDPAQTDFLEILGYIARDNPAAAERVGRRLLSAIDALAAQPRLGRPGRVAGTRELVIPRLPYVAIYRIVEAAHAAHEPGRSAARPPRRAAVAEPTADRRQPLVNARRPSSGPSRRRPPAARPDGRPAP